MSHYYAKFNENSCVGTDASTPYPKCKQIEEIKGYDLSLKVFKKWLLELIDFAKNISVNDKKAYKMHKM